MLEVCFSDALKGGLTFAFLEGKGAFLKDQQDILMPCYGLSFGHVNDVMDMELQEALCKEKEQMQYRQELYKQCRQDLRHLKENAEQQPIRIWVDQTPDSVCGLLFVCHAIAHLNVDVTMIALPQWIDHHDVGVIYSCWGEVSFDQYANFLSIGKPISKRYLKHLAACWERLIQEDAPLRALINGKMSSVDACFYDNRIKQYLSEKAMRVRELTGMVLEQGQLGIGDDVIVHRIIEMINNGEMRVIGEVEDIGWETWIQKG